MTDIEQLVNELQTHLDVAKAEVQALKSGKKSSAPRARKSLQNIKISSHKLRGEIMTHTKSLPTKTRKPKIESVRDEEPLPDPPKLKREETNSGEELEQPAKKTRAKKQTAKAK